MQRLIVFLQLVDDRPRFFNRIRARIIRRKVDDMQQQACACEVTQELMAKPCTFRGAFDQARDVGDNKTAVVIDTHHAQIRVQGCERIISTLRFCRRHRADEGRFACIRHAEQADIGEHFQFELEAARIAFPAAGELPRCTVGAGFEIQIATTAIAAFSE